MTDAVETTCDTHADRFDCPDALLSYNPRFDEYGLIVHDGGRSVISIAHCPWCGHTVPESKRERWFDELQARGIDPLVDDVPPEYRSDEWWARVVTEPAG